MFLYHPFHSLDSQCTNRLYIEHCGRCKAIDLCHPCYSRHTIILCIEHCVRCTRWGSFYLTQGTVLYAVVGQAATDTTSTSFGGGGGGGSFLYQGMHLYVVDVLRLQDHCDVKMLFDTSLLEKPLLPCVSHVMAHHQVARKC